MIWYIMCDNVMIWYDMLSYVITYEVMSFVMSDNIVIWYNDMIYDVW